MLLLIATKIQTDQILASLFKNKTKLCDSVRVNNLVKH